jgi:hypothetical protein
MNGFIAVLFGGLALAVSGTAAAAEGATLTITDARVIVDTNYEWNAPDGAGWPQLLIDFTLTGVDPGLYAGFVAVDEKATFGCVTSTGQIRKRFILTKSFDAGDLSFFHEVTGTGNDAPGVQILGNSLVLDASSLTCSDGQTLDLLKVTYSKIKVSFPSLGLSDATKTVSFSE